MSVRLENYIDNTVIPDRNLHSPVSYKREKKYVSGTGRNLISSIQISDNALPRPAFNLHGSRGHRFSLFVPYGPLDYGLIILSGCRNEFPADNDGLIVQCYIHVLTGKQLSDGRFGIVSINREADCPRKIEALSLHHN